MKTFKIEKILIPIDFSKTSLLAIEHAGFTAQLFKAELILLHVIEKYWEHFSVIEPALVVPSPNEFTNAIEKKLDEVANDIQSKYGVKPIFIAAEGTISSEVIAIAKEYNVDMIVMGTHGISGIAEFFIGSNTYKVVTEAQCPVLSVQGHAEKLGFSNILLPIDDSMHSRQKVNHAVELAKRFGAKIHIVGMPHSDDELVNKRFEMKLDQVEEVLKKEELHFSRKTLKGSNQAKVTLEYAKEVNADLIIIMTDQDEDLTSRLMGSFAQQIVNHSKIPVLSVEPVVGNIEFPNLSGGYHAA